MFLLTQPSALVLHQKHNLPPTKAHGETTRLHLRQNRMWRQYKQLGRFSLLPFTLYGGSLFSSKNIY